MNTTGLDEKSLRDLIKNLSDLPADIPLPALTKALEKGAEVFASAARQQVPVRNGLLRDSIGIIRKKGGKLNPYTMVGPRYYGGWGGQAAHLIEFGTTDRYRFFGNKKLNLQNRTVKAKLLGKAYTGRVTANPFMQPAWNSKKEPVAQQLQKDVQTLVAAAIKKRGFQYKAA